jgi:UDP-N-acetylmuramate--alanine ligase
MDDILQTFLAFANRLPFDGVIMVNGDDVNIQKIIPQIQCEVKTFGLTDQAQIRATSLKFKNEVSSFIIKIDGKTDSDIQLKVPGEHNIKNALAAYAIARELDIPVETIVKSLGKFSGVERRFDIIDEINGIMIVDDYAHHPTEIAETLKSARKGWQRRLIAVFQPHLYSRTRDFYREFANALSLADLVFITDIYPAREEPIPGVSSEMIHKVLNDNGHRSCFIPDKNDLLNELQAISHSGDLLITMGAGDINFTGLELCDRLAKVS